MKKISIIVPVYNAEQYIARCIDSLLNQSYINFELLLVDDGSTDSSGIICDEYSAKDNRVRVFHKVNEGVSSARNLGLDNARGEYIVFCDADDYVSNEWLTAYSDAIDNNIDFAVQGFYEVKGHEISPRRLMRKYYNKDAKKQLIIDLLEDDSFGYIWIKLFRRTIIEKYNIRFNEFCKLGEDSLFISNYLMYAESIISIDKLNYHYVVPPKDKKYSSDAGRSVYYMLKSFDIIFNKNIPYEVFNAHYVYLGLKDYIMIRLLRNERVDEHCLELYNRMIVSLGKNKGLNNVIINRIILNNGKDSTINYLLITLIHSILNIKNKFLSQINTFWLNRKNK